MSSEQPLMTKEQQQFVLQAVRFLEYPSLIIRIADTIGKPLELAQAALPAKWEKTIQSAVSSALLKGLEVAISSVPAQKADKDEWKALQVNVNKKSYMHIAATAATGAIGGFFGLPGMAFELPITTTIMLRSISDIASHYEIDLSKIENRLECLYVFTLGSSANSCDDALDSAYFTSRLAFNSAIRVAAEYLAVHSAREVLKAIERGTAPAVLQFISRVAAYFEIAVTEKMLAEMIPVTGSLGGAVINGLFTAHFTDAAKYHFGIKRLEMDYGEEIVRAEYERAKQLLQATKAS